MSINNIPPNFVTIKDGWIGIEHGNALFVLDRTKKNKSLKRPRTVFSLIIANPSLSATEIYNMMTHVTTIYRLLPWTTNKNPRASIYPALEGAKARYESRHLGVGYRAIRDWYSNLKEKGVNNDAFYPDIITIGVATHPSIQNSSSEPLIPDKEIENRAEYIWSITKDQKIKRQEIHEYRIEYSAKAKSFSVIADGYTFKSGVTLFNAKTKDECIEYIDRITITVKPGTSRIES